MVRDTEAILQVFSARADLISSPHLQHPLRIAVLGAGYVGGALARAAAARGDAVWAVRRAAQTSSYGVTWLSGDISTDAIEGMPGALDAVVLTVAPSGANDGYASTYPPSASAAVRLARASGAKSLVYTSSTGVYGGRDGNWVTEASPRLGAGEGNAALTQAEDIVLAASLAHATVLRVAGIYGPGRDPRARMSQASALAQRGEYWSNIAHRDDIVSAMLHVIDTRPAAPVLNVSDGSPTRAADVARWLAAARGENPDELAFGNDSQRSRNDQRVSNAALCATGWSAHYPSFREGFAKGL
jgi:nucleoside-diphosphate-sugar epimerase